MEEPQEIDQLPLTPTAVESRRRICSGGCNRPLNVCLCDKIPREPIPTTAQIVILQHPHEQRQKLATVPVIRKCLQNCQIIVGRKLRQGSSPLLDSLYHGHHHSRAVFLFPGSECTASVEINEWRSSSKNMCIDGLVLIVFDGTWKHAKEMMYASLPFLSKFASCIYFDCNNEVGGGSIYDSELILKKEPFKGCMSTMEAVARALGILEPSGSGLQIQAKLLEVLKSMVRLQACYLKPIKPRPKLLKNGLAMEP